MVTSVYSKLLHFILINAHRLCSQIISGNYYGVLVFFVFIENMYTVVALDSSNIEPHVYCWKSF